MSFTASTACSSDLQSFNSLSGHVADYQSRPVARGVGGGGGVGRPPQLPIPKILFHPLAILFHPLWSLFHPLAILFHPWNVDDVTRAMSKGGGGCLWMSKSGGVFQIDDVTRTMSKGGGGVRLVFRPSKFRPPHLAGWLRACSLYNDIKEWIIAKTATQPIVPVRLVAEGNCLPTWLQPHSQVGFWPVSSPTQTGGHFTPSPHHVRKLSTYGHPRMAAALSNHDRTAVVYGHESVLSSDLKV